MPLHSHECDCTPPKSTVVQRGAQTDCTQGDCTHTDNTATAWNRQRNIARSAGESAERYTATQFPSRGRASSL